MVSVLSFALLLVFSGLKCHILVTQSPKFNHVPTSHKGKNTIKQILYITYFIECFLNIKQVFLLYQMGSLVRLKAYQPFTLVGSLEQTPLAVKILENRLYMGLKVIWLIITHSQIKINICIGEKICISLQQLTAPFLN